MNQSISRLSGLFLNQANLLNDKIIEVFSSDIMSDPVVFKNTMSSLFSEAGLNLQKIVMSMTSHSSTDSLVESIDMFGQVVEGISTAINKLDFKFDILSVTTSSSTSSGSGEIPTMVLSNGNNIICFIKSHPWLVIGSVISVSFIIGKQKKLPISLSNSIPLSNNVSLPISESLTTNEIIQVQKEMQSRIDFFATQLNYQNKNFSTYIEQQNKINCQIQSNLKAQSEILKLMSCVAISITIVATGFTIYIAINFVKTKYFTPGHTNNELSK